MVYSLKIKEKVTSGIQKLLTNSWTVLARPAAGRAQQSSASAIASPWHRPSSASRANSVRAAHMARRAAAGFKALWECSLHLSK